MHSNLSDYYNKFKKMEGNAYTCRICFDDCLRKELIAPCKCTGTSKWVHRECLDRWRSANEDRAYLKCTECLTPYKLVALYSGEDSWSRYIHRNARFLCYILRDTLLALLATHVVVLSMAALVYFSDPQGAIATALGIGWKSVLLYYGLGWLGTFSVVGMCYCCVLMCSGSTGPSGFNQCDVCYCPYMGSTVGDSACCPCCSSDAHACCSTCGAGGGDCCTGVAVGEECAICLLAAVVILAVVGICVSFFLGMMYMQYLAQKHVRFLSKWNLTKEFIVKDLASGEDDDTSSSLDDLERGVVRRCGMGAAGGGTATDSPLLAAWRVASTADAGPLAAGDQTYAGSNSGSDIELQQHRSVNRTGSSSYLSIVNSGSNSNSISSTAIQYRPLATMPNNEEREQQQQQSQEGGDNNRNDRHPMIV